MRLIKDIDLPDELIEAHRNGELVLFVGAGLSISPPSGIPAFEELARGLAHLAQMPFNAPTRIDEYLGRLDSVIDVRAHTAARVSEPQSAPNNSHRALVRLATAAGVPRIITTNFDDHIAEASRVQLTPFEELYVGPALPDGRTFRGLVHLHGRAQSSTQGLVVTDRDFGRAYLTEAWATRFLQDVFTSRTVLFVGYSHNDLVMDYLAMGLPSDTKRYALVQAADNNRWSRLDVKAIPFPDNDYEAITRLFEAWATFASEGPLATRERVHELVSARSPDQLSITENEYLKWALSTAIGAQSFAERAVGDKWLVWVRAEESFIQLFRSDSSGSPASSILGDWYAQMFVADPSRQNIALDTIRVLGGELSRTVVSKISWALRHLVELDPEMVQPWRNLIESRIHRMSAPAGPLLLSMRDGARDNARTLALLRRAVIPYSSLTSPPWSNTLGKDSDIAPNRPGMTVTWSFTEREVRRLWNDVQSDLATNALEVIEIFGQALMDASYQEASFGERSGVPSYFKRSSIAPHEQNRSHGIQDVLIDGLRDSALAASQEVQLLLIKRWTAFPNPAIFRRIGLHLAAATDLLSTRGKTDLALTVLFDGQLKHEVFELLACIAATDDGKQIRRLIAAVQSKDASGKGASDEEDLEDEFQARRNDRQRFDRLDWIARHTTSGGASEAFTRARAEHPDMGSRPNPDHDLWLSGGVWGGALPMSVEEFVQKMGTDSAGVLQEVVRDYPETNFSEPTWDDALQLIRAAVIARPDLGHRILSWSELDGGLRTTEIDQQVFGAWTQAALEGAVLDWVAILTSMLIRSHVSVGAETRMELLAHYAHIDLSKRANGSIELGRRVAETTLDELQASFSTTHDDWWTTTHTSWPGYLATYWLREAIALYRADHSVEDAIDGTTAGLLAQRNVSLVFTWFLSAELLNFWLLDEQFARDRVSTILLGQGPYDLEYQEVVWDGFLHSTRGVPKEVEDDDFFRRLSQIREWSNTRKNSHSKEAYTSWTAVGLLRADVSESTRDLLLDSYVVSDDHDGLRSVLVQVAGLLEEVGENGPLFAWTPWLTGAIARRVRGVPRRISKKEATAWSNVALSAGAHIGAALAALEGVDAPLEFESTPAPTERGDYFAQEGHASAIASNLLQRVRSTPEIDQQIFYALQEWVEALGNHLSVDALRSIVEAVIRAGKPEAVAWLRN